MRADGWDRCAFPGALRRYQLLALDAVDQLRADGERRAYLVLPPGAGKTVVGLEAARRIGRRTLVLTPNTAVQGQWLRAWDGFGGAAGQHPQPASATRELASGLTVLTYQGVTVWDRGADDEDVADDTSADVAEQRRAALRGEAGSDLLSLLHPRGREMVGRARALGPWTLVLDECHHLLETWGALVRALVRELGQDTWVVGLTATPPADLTERQKRLHDELFADLDFCVPTPAVVKEAELAPFQELVFLTAPSVEEDTWIASESLRFSEPAARAGGPAARHAAVRRLALAPPARSSQRCRGGPQLGWPEVEAAEPAFARAGLRLAHAGVIGLPVGARLREQHRVPTDAQDWAVLLGGYAREHLLDSTDLADQRLLHGIREVLPGLGWLLTRKGLRATTSPVDRVCALSESKAAAAVQVLAAESDTLGEDLRAVVLCDFEDQAAVTASRVDDGTQGRQTGSARLAFLTLARCDRAATLRPVLCTGRTVAMRREDLAAFRAFAPPGLADRLLAEPFEGTRSLVSLTIGSGWSARTWTPLMTDWLVAGGTQVVVSTRALLGEGWDCPPLNVVLDLSSAATATSVTQVRGRSLRLDPERPDKVADNWSIVCVADGHPRGDADYLRTVRKHEHHLVLGRDGLIESGIGHCDEALSPYAAPDAGTRAAVNGRALLRVGERAAVRAGWGIGEPYVGSELSTLRLRTGRPFGLPGGLVPTRLLDVRTTLGAPAPAALPPRAGTPARLWPLPIATAVVGSAAVTATGGPVWGAATGLGAGLLTGGAVAGRRYTRQLRALRRLPADGDTAGVVQLARAVADALRATGGTSAASEAVRVVSRPGGWLAVELDAPPEQSLLFATCLDELVSPLGAPGWLVSRLVLPSPAAAADRRRLARARAVGRPVEAAVAWHAVPAWLGRSKAKVAAFDTAWREHVGAGRLVRGSDPEGAALLDLLRGEDPFAVTSRLRTTWR